MSGARSPRRPALCLVELRGFEPCPLHAIDGMLERSLLTVVRIPA
jgi:hypothetical protein